MKTETKIAIFQGKQVRKTIYKNEWWFAVNDVIEVLTNTPNPKDYIKKVRNRDKELNKGWGQIVTPLYIKTAGGYQKLSCADTEGIFRIIQSIPSPKAELFKRWLARVGYERIQEINDPELAMKRMRAIYQAKGYSQGWIEKRVRGFAICDELTDEWKKRDVQKNIEYAILTAEISKATFGMTPSEYKKYKQLKRENLRDHMTDLELIFSMLGEAATTEITKNKNALGFKENRQTAKEGGRVAGKARRDLERKSGRRIISKQNYLQNPQNKSLKTGKG